MPRQKTYTPRQKTFNECHQKTFVWRHMWRHACPSVSHTNEEERQTQTPFFLQGSKPPLCSLRSGVWFHLSHSWVEVSLDDDIHVIEKVKGFILPQFYCMKYQHRPNRMQIDIPTTNDRPSRTESMLATAWACPLPSKTPSFIYRLAMG
jgi:hypothetical protein